MIRDIINHLSHVGVGGCVCHAGEGEFGLADV